MRKKRLLFAVFLLLLLAGCVTIDQKDVRKYKKQRNVEKLIAAVFWGSTGYVKDDAIEALVEINDPRAVEPLIAALESEHMSRREIAAKALGEISDPRAVEPLILVLKDEVMHVRSEAAEALGKIKDPRAVEPLVATLKDVKSLVRGMAAEALGKINDPRAVEPLIAVLKDKDEWVREMAGKALGEIEGPLTIEPKYISHTWVLSVKAAKGNVHAKKLSVSSLSMDKVKEYELDAKGKVDINLSEIEKFFPQLCFEAELNGVKAEHWISIVKKAEIPNTTFIVGSVGSRAEDIPEWLYLGVNHPNIYADRIFTSNLKGIGRIDVLGSPGVTVSVFKDAIVYWEGSGVLTDRWTKTWIIIK